MGMGLCPKRTSRAWEPRYEYGALSHARFASMAEKNCFDMTKLIVSSHVSVTVVQWSGSCYEHADKPGLTPGHAVFCFFVPLFFFFCLVSFIFNTIFPFGLFSLC